MVTNVSASLFICWKVAINWQEIASGSLLSCVLPQSLMRTSLLHKIRGWNSKLFPEHLCLSRQLPLQGFHFIQRGGRSLINKNVLSWHIEKNASEARRQQHCFAVFFMATQALFGCLG